MPAITVSDLNNAKLDVDHIAEVATSTAPTATDRLGHTKSTVQGAVDSLKAFNPRGSFAAGVSYAIKDVYTSGGLAYAVVVAHTSTSVSADLAGGKVAVHQGVTIEALSAPGAASLIGGGGMVVSSISALRGLLKTSASKHVISTGYYAQGDGGGGAYWYDSTDTTSTDNGGTIIVAADGGRWKFTGEPTARTFGAKGDGSQNDQPFLQAFIDWAQAPTSNYVDRAVRIGHGFFSISTPLVVKHGGESNRAIIDGSGSTLYCSAAMVTAIDVIASGTTGYLWNGQSRIKGFRIECASNAQRGIRIGAAFKIDSAFKSLVDSVDIRDYTVEGISITDTRLWQFTNCTIFSGNPAPAVGLYATAADLFSADLWFTDCQFAVPVGAPTACVKANVTVGSVAGIHFTNCVHYGVLADLGCSAAGSISDIFFTSCAQDGMAWSDGSTRCVSVHADAANKIRDIFINDCWLNAGYFGVFFVHVSGGQINGGRIHSTQLNGVYFENCLDCVVNGVSLFDVNTLNNGGGAINLGMAGARNKVVNNSIFNASGHSSVIINIGAPQLKPVVVGNTTDAGVCVSNSNPGVAGTDYYIAGNLS